MVAKLAYTSGRRMSNCEGDEWLRFAGQRANLEENNNGTERVKEREKERDQVMDGRTDTR